eukprot:GHVH01014075.1.p1 GENE.GHVH01014075.1~~GHVH01014075.1.p1  ORF type:complete len:171 (-),score=7.03 GHVH01014075.1:264-776(-)
MGSQSSKANITHGRVENWQSIQKRSSKKSESFFHASPSTSTNTCRKNKSIWARTSNIPSSYGGVFHPPSGAFSSTPMNQVLHCSPDLASTDGLRQENYSKNDRSNKPTIKIHEIPVYAPQPSTPVKSEYLQRYRDLNGRKKTTEVIQSAKLQLPESERIALGLSVRNVSF